MSKICPNCKKEKSLSEWNKDSARSSGTQAYCRECTRLRDREYYHSNRQDRKNKIRERAEKERERVGQMILEYKKQGCKFCKEIECICMDFHHLRDKDFAIGDSTRKNYSLNRVKKEIEKCLVVCSNCHRKIHAGLIKI